MRKALLALGLVVPLGAQYLDILVYADDYYTSNPDSLLVIKALSYLRDSVSLTWTLYYQDPDGFGNALGQGDWDMVIVDHAYMYGIGNWWDSLANWVLVPRHALIVSTYDVDGSATGATNLWWNMGVQSTAGDIPDLDSLEVWDGILSSPEPVGPMVGFVNNYSDEGDSLSVRPGFVALAGWGPSYAGDNAAIITASPPDCRSVLNSFIVEEARPAKAWENPRLPAGLEEGTKIYIDEIWYLINCMALGLDNRTRNPEPALSFSPNPFGDLLRIQAPPGARVSLWDVSGRLVRAGVCQGTLMMDTRGLAPGAYVLVIEETHGRTHSAVILKQ